MDAAWQADGTITFAVWRDNAYRVVATGGTPTRVLGAYNVDHMASDGTTLFVQSSCGIQSTPL
jgi:hypothetical protein